MALEDEFGDGRALVDQLMVVIRRDGLMDLLGGLNEVGADDVTTSWMSAGPNRPVAADQVADALGATRSQEMADALGVTREQVAAGVARVLPPVVDRLTPDGRYPDHAALAAADLTDLDVAALLR
ncbi:YidB family protein [Dermatobacter hominis]|uniref:YidB family protein n=1 Tax=Dermatobacter hominis TaxID=2884263 RepID=UPI001D10529B|nr:YidB family protein [Dermatobacter hominis]UDY35328.1 YidB family protein [Dermatobacter hominis]